MNYGLYLAASGLQTGMHRLDVAANNLANVNTTGFKPDISILRQRDVASVEDNLPFLPSNQLLERLGGGVLLEPTEFALDPAGISVTNNPLDLAIDGPGFFTLDSGQGAGVDRLRLTRDGSFTLDTSGRLVQIGTGLPVLDDAGAPIRVDPRREVEIRSSGEVAQEGDVVARLNIVAPRDPLSLEKVGDNHFRSRAGATLALDQSASLVRAGALENSGVNPIDAIMSVTQASGSVRQSTEIIRRIDNLMDRAINTFASIS